MNEREKAKIVGLNFVRPEQVLDAVGEIEWEVLVVAGIVKEEDGNIRCYGSESTLTITLGLLEVAKTIVQDCWD